MKYSLKYVGFFFVIIIVGFLKWNHWSDDYSQVDTFRGAQLEEEVFYPLKAMNINDEKMLRVTIDDVEFSNVNHDIVVNNHLNPAVSFEFLREHWGCNVYITKEGEINLKRNGVSYQFVLGSKDGKRGGMLFQLSDAPYQAYHKCYLPLDSMCQIVSATYQWEEESYELTIKEDTLIEGKLPQKFDLRDDNRVPEVANQGNDATCWAYAALNALKSTLLPGEQHQYSAKHMTTKNDFHISSKQGGEYTMAMAYLLSWKGPVEEKETNKHVQEVHLFEREEKEEIKWGIYRYGGVTTSLYVSGTNNITASNYYNKKTNAYCYKGGEKPNHDVVIIGWDDTYPAKNFSSNVTTNGAFICQNSWGEKFGEQGVFYVSYEDVHIGSQSAAYVRVEEVDNYDTIYQSDLCGWVGQIGYQKSKILAANVYQAKKEEDIVAAGFYALGDETSYEIYMVSKVSDVSDFNHRQLVGKGKVEHAGYYTIDFDIPWRVEEKENYAVVILLDSPGKKLPMAIEYQADEMTEHVDVSDGQGYISNNGMNWESVEENAKGNLCLKAYGRKVMQEE